MPLGPPVAAFATQIDQHHGFPFIASPSTYSNYSTIQPPASSSSSISVPLQQIIALNSTLQPSQAELSTTTATFDLQLRPISSGELVLVGLLIGLIIVSIVGNCLVCVAIFTDRRLRKLGNAFIVSLAIADLFVSCLVMTFALCNDLMNYWIFGDWFCDVWISFDIMCSTASILNLCAISLDRFIHIKDCLLYNQWMTRRVAISAVIIIWFISALVSFVPITLGWHRPDHHFGHKAAAAAASIPHSAVGGSQAMPWAPQATQPGTGANTPVAGATYSGHIVAGANLHKLDYSRADYGLSGAASGETGATTAVLAAESKAIENQSSPLEPPDSGDDNSPMEDYGNNNSSSNSSRPEQLHPLQAWRPDKRREDFVSSQTSGGSSPSPGGRLARAGNSSGRRREASDGPSNELAANRTAAARLAAITQASAQFNQVESNSQDGSQIGELNPASGRPHPTVGSGRASGPARHDWSVEVAAQQLAYQEQEPTGSRQQPNAPSGQGHQTAPPSTPSASHQPQCMLTLTPTYAIISSTISFYIPCIIMLGLYTKLFACARRHVRNIQAITKAPAPIAVSQSIEPVGQAPANAVTTFMNSQPGQQLRPGSNNNGSSPPPPPLKTWLKFGPRRKPKTGSGSDSPIAQQTATQHNLNAQSQNDKSINANQHNTGKGILNRCRPASVHRLLGGGSGADSRAAKSSRPPALPEQNEICQRNNMNPTSCSAELDPLPVAEQQQRQLPVGQAEQTDKPSDGTASKGTSADNKVGANNERGADNLIITRAPIESQRLDPSQTYAMPLNRPEPDDSEPTRQRQLQHDSRGPSAEERRPFLNQLGESVVVSSGHGPLSRSKSCSTKKGSTKVNFQGPNQQQSGQLATHKAAVTLGIIMGTFLFCWVPFFCLNIIKAFCVDCIPSSVFRAFTWLGYANSALNPIIYGIHNSEFRNAFNRIFFKHLNIKNSRYYINRRFSYDIRHPTAPTNRMTQQNCLGRTNTTNAHQHHRTLKSDHAIT